MILILISICQASTSEHPEVLVSCILLTNTELITKMINPYLLTGTQKSWMSSDTMQRKIMEKR